MFVSGGCMSLSGGGGLWLFVVMVVTSRRGFSSLLPCHASEAKPEGTGIVAWRYGTVILWS